MATVVHEKNTPVHEKNILLPAVKSRKNTKIPLDKSMEQV